MTSIHHSPAAPQPASGWLDRPLSTGAGIYGNPAASVTLPDWAARLREDTPALRNVRALKDACVASPDDNSATTAYKTAKNELPWVILPAHYHAGRRRITDPCEPSGIAFAEVDNLQTREYADDVASRYYRHPAVLAAWTSVSGYGVHLAVAVSPTPANAEQYAVAWQAVVTALELDSDTGNDPSVKNINRLAFASYCANATCKPPDASITPICWTMPTAADADADAGTGEDHAEDPAALLRKRLAEVKQPPYETLVKHGAASIAILAGSGEDTDSVLLALPNGYWTPLSFITGNTGSVALEMLYENCYQKHANELADELGIDHRHVAPPGGLPALTKAAHQLNRLPYLAEPPTGIPRIAEEDCNDSRYVRLDNNAVLDLDTADIIQSADRIRTLHLLNAGGKGMAFRPELLDDPPNGVPQLLAHFGEIIFRRFAYQFAAPNKEIDTFVSALPQSGKDTLCALLKRACAGTMIYKTPKAYLSGQGQKFTALERDLCAFRLVGINEVGSDKVDNIPAALITNLTSDSLDDEQKGKPSRHRPRRGNTFLIGNAVPAYEQAPGVGIRLRWAFLDGFAGAITPTDGLRNFATRNHAVSDWVSTFILATAIRFRKVQFRTDEFQQGYADASGMHDSLVPPEVTALQEAGLVAHPGGWVSSNDIRNALAAADLETAKNARLSKWVKAVVPVARYSPRKHNGKSVNGYAGAQFANVP